MRKRLLPWENGHLCRRQSERALGKADRTGDDNVTCHVKLAKHKHVPFYGGGGDGRKTTTPPRPEKTTTGRRAQQNEKKGGA